MNLKFSTKSGYISDVKERLYSLFPKMQNIQVKIDRTPTKSFRTTIICKIKNKRIVVARKRCESYFSSLEKAEQAIVKQVLRIKDNWKKRRPGKDKGRLFYAT